MIKRLRARPGRMFRWAGPLPLVGALLVQLVAASGVASAQGQAAAPASASTPRAAAPIDLTGYWVAIISEDWRWRMVTPARGDYASIPLNAEGKQVADLWDPARDEAAGEHCRAYGAPGVMRGPTRLHVTWLDDYTLKLDTDYGSQSRLFRFGTPAPSPGAPTWQGVSVAQWVMAAAVPTFDPQALQPVGGGRAGGGAQRYGSMKSVTTNLRAGYLRKNGVPYSAVTVYTEYWDVHRETNGDLWMVVTNVVNDPENLQLPWITALHFKKEANGSKWDPTPCNARF